MTSRVVALAGGTGSAKLLVGLASQDVDLTVVANVGDNFWFHGAYVCPDIDIALYSLAGVADRRKGWGIQGDTFHTLSAISELGGDSWFKLGDRDLALCMLRTGLLKSGESLTQITARFQRSLGVVPVVLPATDSHIETRIRTPAGEVHLQEFWVREGGSPEVLGVRVVGVRSAQPTKAVLGAIRRADRVIICPANPITSIRPILALKGIVKALRDCAGDVVAVSPMVGEAPFSGPAGKLMRACGVAQTSEGVASEYQEFIDAILISEGDSGMTAGIQGLGVRCAPTDTSLSTQADRVRVAREALSA